LKQSLETSVAAAVLAGGRSARMGGRDKCWLPFEGSPLILCILKTLRHTFEEVLLVCSGGDEYGMRLSEAGINGVILADDVFTGRGPLGGIHAGLSCTSKEAVLFVACDMPYLNPELIRRMIDEYRRVNSEVLIPLVGDYIEPLHAIYRSSLSNAAREILTDSQGYSIRRLLSRAVVHQLQLEATPEIRRSFVNLNTPEDFARES
jgi:molybdopterin-guanine dinucleotide biosynthesis protein A